jgi:flagellar protein FlbD
MKGPFMIRLTRLNGSSMFLNADLVATVETHHDTVVTLVDGRTYVVLESAEKVVEEITQYRANVLAATERAMSDEEPGAVDERLRTATVLPFPAEGKG